MRYLVVLFFLMAGAALLRAQDYAVTPLDGPATRADSLQARPGFAPRILNPFVRPNPLYERMAVPMFETREQRAARINERAHRSVMASVSQDMPWIRASLIHPFLTPTPRGYTSLQGSNPMILGKKPGMAPFDNPYSPENFPQTIRTEYDFATGTYKTVPVSWTEYQASHQFRFNPANVNNAPVPQVQLTPGDRFVR